MEFIKFYESSLEKIYKQTEGDDILVIRTKSGDEFDAVLDWEQGRGNNWKFNTTYRTYFPSDIESYAFRKVDI